MEAGQVGAKLRDARVARGLSLEDIANTTKVPRSMLVLLETDAFQKMPAPVFVRGFIRSYAKVVGIDANPIVRAFEHRSTGVEHAVVSAPQQHSDAPAREPRSRVGLNTDRKLTPIEPLSEPREGMFRGGYALLAVVAVGLLIAAWLMVGGKRNGSETTSARVNDPIGVEGALNAPGDDNVPSLDSPRPNRDVAPARDGWTSVPREQTGDPSVDTPRPSDERAPSPRGGSSSGRRGGNQE